MLTFRYRKDLQKKKINATSQKIDKYLGQTFFVENARTKFNGFIEVKDIVVTGV